MSCYRPEFEAGLRLLARISRAMDEAGHRPPVLVGGGAVELYTGGAVTTGDFDLSCGRQDVLERIMQEHGFVRPSGPGAMTRGWIHPDPGRRARRSGVIGFRLTRAARARARL